MSKKEEEELAPDLDSILNGSFAFDDESEEEEDQEGTEEEEDAENIEDTDEDSDEEEEEETNNENADSSDDTSNDDSKDDNGENAQENDDKSNEDDTDDKNLDDGSNAESDDKSENEEGKDSNSESNTDAESNTTEPEATVDYKAFYESLTNAEFKANGKTVKGFTDPSKIIRAQQMLYGFEEKMSGFKQYRPFVGSLKKTGLIDNPAKFNIMMDIMSGDKEALKQFIKDSNIDPIIDLDLDAINYNSKNYVDSKQSLDIEDTLEIAKNLGIEDKFRETVGKRWDDESFKEFTSTPEVREDLLEHMTSRIDPNDETSPIIYDAVQEKISEMKLLDNTGTFGAKSSINQYRTAVVALSNDLRNKQVVAKKENNSAIIPEVQNTTTTQADVEAEKAKILNKRKEEEYAKELDKKDKLDAEKRRKASSVSKTKPTTVEKKVKFDPLTASSEEFIDNFEKLLGRK